MGLWSWLTGGSGNSKDLTALINQTQPLINAQTGYANYGFAEGQKSTQEAKNILQEPLDYYKKILGGSYNDILEVLNSDEVIKSYDDQARIINEFAPRGGNTAAAFSLNEFNKQSELNTALQKIKAQAPQDLTQIAQVFAGMAQQEFALTGNIQNAISNLFQIQAFRNANKDKKVAAIQGLLNAIAGTAGGLSA